MLTYLIPSAKEMVEKEPLDPQPLYPNSQAILDTLGQLSLSDLAKVYAITPLAAEREQLRLQELLKGQAKTYPALNLFNGLMYRQINRDLSPSQLDFIHRQVFITTALYGIIPAHQPIAPHRLDFHTKIKIDGKSLKSLWRPFYDSFADNQEHILSLLSSEFEEVFSPQVRQAFIRLTFYEEKDGQLKSHSTISKKARGAFISTIIQETIDDLTAIKNLSVNGFSYREDLSEDQELVFVKRQI